MVQGPFIERFKLPFVVSSTISVLGSEPESCLPVYFVAPVTPLIVSLPAIGLTGHRHC